MAKRPNNDFVISRVFDAPRDRVWQAVTDAGHMTRWWGPRGFTVFASAMDLRAGGTYHFGMSSPNGAPMWGLFRFREVTPPERLVFMHSFSDEKGGVARHGGHMLWPLEMLTTLTFQVLPAGKTMLTVRSAAHDATAEEQAVFDTSHDDMAAGWSGTLDKLETHLSAATIGVG